jgi:hypothetical protein
LKRDLQILLVSQGLDWLKGSRAVGGVNAEEQADRRREEGRQ